MSAERSTPQLHYSGLDLLWRCGVAFEFRHIKKVKAPPTSALHVGRGVDEAANVNLTSKIETQELLPTEQVLDIARDTVKHVFTNEGVMLGPGEDNEKAACDLAVDKAVRLTKAHATILAPTLKPKFVQRQWTMTVPGFPFDIVGTRDLDETDETIRDLKTSGKSPAKTAAFTSDQGTMYALSKWVVEKIEPPIRFVLDTIVDLKRETKVSFLESTRTKADFQVMVNRIENAARILETGAFTPARQTDWWCSQRWCSYANQCPYFRRPVSVAVNGEDE